MYPIYNPYQSLIPQNTQQNIQYVNGKASADAYQMTPNSSVLLMDSTQCRFYIKQTDASGIATVKTYEFKEVTDTPVNSDYVTRAEFDAFKAEMNKPEEAGL